MSASTMLIVARRVGRDWALRIRRSRSVEDAHRRPGRSPRSRVAPPRHAHDFDVSRSPATLRPSYRHAQKPFRDRRGSTSPDTSSRPSIRAARGAAMQLGRVLSLWSTASVSCVLTRRDREGRSEAWRSHPDVAGARGPHVIGTASPISKDGSQTRLTVSAGTMKTHASSLPAPFPRTRPFSLCVLRLGRAPRPRFKTSNERLCPQNITQVAW